MKTEIAKRYTDALVDGASKEELVALEAVFASLAQALEDPKTKTIFESPYMDNATRTDILLAAVASAKSDKINNTVKLLVEKRRTDILGAIASSIALIVSNENKSYVGKVYANSKVKKATLTKLGSSIGKKLDSKIVFEAVEDEYNGVKVAVDDLGVEVSFSKSNVRNQMIQHILKSI